LGHFYALTKFWYGATHSEVGQKAWQESLRLQALRQRGQALQAETAIAVTHAAVADTTDFETLVDASNTSRDVYADRAIPALNE
jgi:hypothetical protein